jgi:hypothetical protein
LLLAWSAVRPFLIIWPIVGIGRSTFSSVSRSELV